MDIKSLINKRRSQILIHSYLYYKLCDSIIDDQTFDGWSKELVRLQLEFPKIAAECIYAKEFETFDGTTGFYLPRDKWVESKANQLIRYSKSE